MQFAVDASIQCVAVSVISISSDVMGEESCLSLRLSTTTTVNGLTVNPNQASVCVVSANGRYTHVQYSLYIIYWPASMHLV